jgi:hypothetical protein
MSAFQLPAARDAFIAHGSLPGEHSHHDSRLAQVVSVDRVRKVGVRMPRAHVVVAEIFD